MTGEEKYLAFLIADFIVLIGIIGALMIGLRERIESLLFEETGDMTIFIKRIGTFLLIASVLSINVMAIVLSPDGFGILLLFLEGMATLFSFFE
jgi:hypothetical protein|nr:MAG TPA: hypothetical protein [Caudoviricetes sp.]